MRVAALYDVHGNLPALEAVLADPRLADVDLIVSGGDLVAGPMPSACLDLLGTYGSKVQFVRGNADRNVLERVEEFGGAWSASELGPERLAVVAGWPLTIELDAAGGTTFCHATPRFDDDLVTRLTPDDELAAVLEATPTHLIVAGHTHIQVDRLAGSHRFVVAGSVGRPYEGRKGAFWALLEEDVELVHTDYDVESAAAAIRATEFPDADEHADTLLDPPQPDEVSAYFESLRGA